MQGSALQFGTLRADWDSGAQHDGEHYEVHLCERCFFATLSQLRRERQVNTMFDEQTETAEGDFGLVRRGVLGRKLALPMDYERYMSFEPQKSNLDY
ncbi:hypothetical protein A210_13995 [Pseudomonas putida SJTE-1]|uniref:Uncharacterized protein n=1 Tax=Pseudomonas putida ND6 TaxID=231023 RepID=I3V4N1_PSEPU|nr:hypothetical protein YSA_10936 [Pseudomonas putida ND6]ANI03701.1 hypothetical protein A210_13995 [Pseudomonas putida SJTE-1]